MLCPWITISRTSPRSTAAINSLKIISGSRRYCLLKTLKIINKTSAKTNQSAICFEDGFKQLLRAAAADSSSCEYRHATEGIFFPPSNTRCWLAADPVRKTIQGYKVDPCGNDNNYVMEGH